ncbi:MAG: 4-(cytidine 5'-diphospho)-2-C-methyl-D-erythritol kinase [Flammeovirgaceae bacterium]
MISFPNAKINLGLNVLSKREDGYHNLSTCFYPIEWSDILEITPSESFEIQLSGLPIYGKIQENLCVKAYHLLKKDFDIPLVKIHLHKLLPMGAGIGGGSADGSFTLKLLNQMFSLNLSDEQLEKYALLLGSDCPFFIQNKPVLAEGRGEIFKPISLNLNGKYIILVFPNFSVSTKEAFSGIKPRVPQKSIGEVLNQSIDTWKNDLYNDFEKSIFPRYPQLSKIKDFFYEKDAIYASMSGSGSTMYGIFDQETELDIESFFAKDFVVWKGFLK